MNGEWEQEIGERKVWLGGIVLRALSRYILRNKPVICAALLKKILNVRIFPVTAQGTPNPA